MRLYLQKSLQEVFLMLIFVALPDWMFFILRLFSMPPALHLGISGLLRPSSALGSTVVTFGFLLFTGFSVTSLSRFIASAKVLSGLSFIPRHFILHSFPTFWRIYDLDASRSTLSRIFFYACFYRVVPSS